MKKLISLILAVLMAVTAFGSVGAFAAVSENDVCKIGDTGYATVEAAITAAEPGATIALLKDTTISEVALSKNIVIDGNSKTLTSSETSKGFFSLSSQLTIKNCKLVSTAALGEKKAYFGFASATAKLTLEDCELNITTATGNAKSAIVYANGTPIDVNLKNVKAQLHETAPNVMFLYEFAGGNVVLSGNTTVTSASATSMINGSVGVAVDFNMTLNDTAVMESFGGNNTMYVSGAKASSAALSSRGEVNLTMNGDSKIYAFKTCVGLHGTSAKHANITLNDTARIHTKVTGENFASNNGYAVRLDATTATIVINDEASITTNLSSQPAMRIDKAAVDIHLNSSAKALKVGAGFTCYAPVMNGAEMRIDESSYGLRFSSTFTWQRSTTMTQTYGTIIAKADSIGNVDFTKEALTAASVKFVDIPCVGGYEDDAEMGRTFNAALVDIKEANYGVEFAARSYVEYSTTEAMNANVTVKCYSTVCTATPADVAFEQLADVKDASEEGYRNAVDSYPVLNTETNVYAWTEGTKYSKLSDAQYVEVSAFTGKK